MRHPGLLVSALNTAKPNLYVYYMFNYTSLTRKCTAKATEHYGKKNEAPHFEKYAEIIERKTHQIH